MPSFKIVSTQEKRGIYFTVVPHKWEQNKVLFWPTHLKYSERERLRSDPNSTPDLESWERVPCILKYSNIHTFCEGLEMEKKLTSCVDSDAEEALFANISKAKFEMDASCTIDRNEMFDSPLFSPTENNKIKIISQQTVQPAILEKNDPSVIYSGHSQQKIFIDEFGMDEVDDQHCLLSAIDKNEILTIKEDIADIKADVVNIKQEMCTMKQELKIQTTKINLNLDKIYQLLSARNYSENADVQQKQKLSTEDLLQKYQFPLSSTAEISKLDEEIRNNNAFKEQLVTALSRIGGTSGDEDGGKIAYKIIDFLFKSDVLINFSWTGVSRGKSGEKTSFQILEGIVNVLFDVILLADSRHTRKKNANILKDGVLKHAKKRSMRKRALRSIDQNKNVDEGQDNEHTEDKEASQSTEDETDNY